MVAEFNSAKNISIEGRVASLQQENDENDSNGGDASDDNGDDHGDDDTRLAHDDPDNGIREQDEFIIISDSDSPLPENERVRVTCRRRNCSQDRDQGAKRARRS